MRAAFLTAGAGGRRGEDRMEEGKRGLEGIGEEGRGEKRRGVEGI